LQHRLLAADLTEFHDFIRNGNLIHAGTVWLLQAL